MDINNIRIDEIVSTVTLLSEKGHRDSMKSRSSYGLSFCDGGKITYIQNGKKYVSDKNSVIILPKNGTYKILRQETGMFFVINFNSDNLDISEFAVFPISSTERIYDRFCRLRDAFYGAKRLEAMAEFYKILSFVFEHNKDKLLGEATRFIEDNIGNSELSNRSIAEHLKISETYLNRRFVKLLSVTPRRYIIEKRIEKAKMLLSETEQTVSEICENCGYSNIYSFSRAFKEAEGIPPTDYKKRIMKQ